MKKPISYFYIPFGEAFKNFRTRYNKTLCDIALLMHISSGFISDVENARRKPFSGELLHKLKEHFPAEDIEELMRIAVSCRVAEIEDLYHCVDMQKELSR